MTDQRTLEERLTALKAAFAAKIEQAKSEQNRRALVFDYAMELQNACKAEVDAQQARFEALARERKRLEDAAKDIAQQAAAAMSKADAARRRSVEGVPAKLSWGGPPDKLGALLADPFSLCDRADVRKLIEDVAAYEEEHRVKVEGLTFSYTTVDGRIVACAVQREAAAVNRVKRDRPLLDVKAAALVPRFI
jgi:hypothetical protein